MGGRGRGGWWGQVDKPKAAIRPQTVVLCPQQTTGMYTNHRIDWDSRWQQFGTQPILISAPQWGNRSCNVPTWLYRVSKKPSVKADLAIYSHAVDVRGQCMSELLILGQNSDFSSCDIMVGFCKSSHIWRRWSWAYQRSHLSILEGMIVANQRPKWVVHLWVLFFTQRVDFLLQNSYLSERTG